MSRPWLLPVVLGAIAGGIVALLGSTSHSETHSTAVKPLATSASLSAVSANSDSLSAPRLEPSTTPASASPTTLTSAPPPAPSAPASSAGAPASAAAKVRAPAFDLSEPLTEQALTEAQVACNRQTPDACERAALGLESGRAGIKDPVRARGLRRIALTLYVKQCESASRVLACARLAEMYDTGAIVQANPRNAAALRLRVDELCAKHTNDPECQSHR
jgi:TPR repeat protein